MIYINDGTYYYTDSAFSPYEITRISDSELEFQCGFGRNYSKRYLCIVLIKNSKEKENNNTNFLLFLLWVIIMTKKQFHITYSVLLAILLIASEAVIYILFGEKQLTDNAQISRLTGVVLIVPIILSFLKDFVLEKRQKLQLAFLDFCIAACACCSVVVAVVYQKNIVLSAPLWEILAVIVFAVAVLMIILFVIYKSVKSKNV